MQEAQDFKAECDSIAAILDSKSETELNTQTLFKGWTINDIIGHLHLWNIAADKTLNEPEEFIKFATKAMGLLGSGKSHPEIHATPIWHGKIIIRLWLGGIQMLIQMQESNGQAQTCPLNLV